MSLLDSMKKIIAPENTIAQANNTANNSKSEILNGAPALTNPNDARLARLRAAMAAQLTEQANTPVAPEPVAINLPIQEGPSNTPTLESTIKSNPEIITEEKKSSPINIVEQPEATSISLSVERVSNSDETTSSVAPDTINESSKDGNKEIIESASGRELMTIFLSEVNDLLAAGQKLEELTKERAESSEKAKEINSENISLKESAEKIQASIDALISMEDEESLSKNLQSAKDELTKYQDAFTLKLSTLETEGRKIDSSLLISINKQKAEIKSILNAIGGDENFGKIKKFIRFAERRSKEYLIDKGYNPETAKETVNDIRKQAINELLSGAKMISGKDLEGTKLLVSSGDIVGIFMRILNEKLSKNPNQ